MPRYHRRPSPPPSTSAHSAVSAMPQADFEADYFALMRAKRYAEAHVFLCARSGLDPETTYSKARLLARHPRLAQ